MDDPDLGSGRDAGVPRWVIVVGVVALLLVLVIVGLHRAGLGLGGHHG